ncbi:hypothetical protein MLD38_034623 [Melastoma candidum]|uniref:Uncharacterized protein n=1 Tax=Melastoma candidum TaxID=119954 RepID=A0ACB9MB29_9MYRT|nr:hypothetical protein MLD38_034623 [Melastoma candidum]
MTGGGVPPVTLGGKGATALTSTALFAVSVGRARLSLDASSYDRLSAGPAPQQQPAAIPLASSPIPPYFTPAEHRAALTVLLNKLLATSGSSSVRALLPDLILVHLNSNDRWEAFKFETLCLTEEESCLVERSCCGLYGVCGILDHQVTALSAVIDAVVALSCEAVRADVGCFNLMDSGDGFVSKEEIGVAGDLRVLLNGSKLVGKVEVEGVASVPKVNGVLRKVAKALHAESRVNLNSALRKGKSGDGAGEAVTNVVLPLADVVFNLGKSSLGRVKMNLDSIGHESLKNDLEILFENKSVKSDDLRGQFKVVVDSYVVGDCHRFVHEVLGLVGMVWKIVAWELVTSLVVFEGSELVVESESERDGEGNGKQVDKKSEKKKKKMVLGKGTSVILQLFKDVLQRKEGFGSSSAEYLEKLVSRAILFVETKDSEFDDFLTKVKDIVDSNQSRRLPKLPKVKNRQICKLHCRAKLKAQAEIKLESCIVLLHVGVYHST